MLDKAQLEKVIYDYKVCTFFVYSLFCDSAYVELHCKLGNKS